MEIKGFPASLALGLFIYAWLFFYLFYIHNIKGTSLNAFEFYTLTLIPILILTSVRGTEFFEAFGFTLGKGNAGIKIARFILALIIGFSIGFVIYYLGKMSAQIYGYFLFPADIFLLQLFLSPVLLQNLVNAFIVAFHEEILRITSLFIFNNYFYRKGIKAHFELAVILSSVLFVLIHYFSWGGLSMPVIFTMSIIVIVITLSGMLLHRNFLGNFGIESFTIWVPMFAHLFYDLFIFLNLSVYGAPMSMQIIQV